MYEKNFYGEKLTKDEGGTNRFINFLVIFYFAACFIEPFANLWIGSSVFKYYMLFLLAVVFLFKFSNISVSIEHFMILGWLIYMITSLLWNSPAEGMSTVRSHFISQIGMVFIYIVLTSVKFSSKTIEKIVFWSYITSFVLCILALFFSENQTGSDKGRYLLVLFGKTIDPNNLASMYIFSVAVALNYIFFKREKILLNAIALLVAVAAILFTSSRGGFVSLLLVALVSLIFMGNSGYFKHKTLAFLIFVIIIALMFVILPKVVPQDALSRVFDFESYEGGSNRSRIWKKVFDNIMQHPLFGNGWGAYDLADHNTYLGILQNVGIFGFVLFSGMIVKPLILAIKQKNILAVLILVSGMAPAFFFEAINKRMVWNVIIIATMLVKEKDSIFSNTPTFERGGL